MSTSKRPRIGLDARKARDYGIGSYTRHLISAIAANPRARSYEFLLFAPSRDAGIFAGLPSNFRLVEEEAGGYSLAELFTYPRRLRRHRLDLFHAFHYVLPPRAAPRSVVTIHDVIHLSHSRFFPMLARPYARAMIRRSTREAARIIAVSHATRRELESRFAATKEKIRVVENGIGDAFRSLRAPEEVERVARKYSLPARFALFVGGGKPHKNLARILEAFARAIPDLSADADLVVAGRGISAAPEAPRDAAGRVRVLAEIDPADLPALYAKAEFLLSPTLAEGFGLPAVEAMACSTPVLVSDIAVYREVCGEAALFVDPLDPASIAAGIVALFGKPELRRDLAKKGMERADAFSWERAADRTLSVYGEALAS